jgi:SAM-dependent methyltransferase
MTIVQSPATFGAGGSEPYARALRGGVASSLFLHENRSGHLLGRGSMDIARWSGRADDTDLSLLVAVDGPVLDVGCGPGRMVRAAMDLGLEAMGVDVSPAAIEVARAEGLAVIEGSVFDPLPGEGAWQTILLVDGNIGIGGDVAAMLDRCLELAAPRGEVVVELNSDPNHEDTYTGTLVDALGHRSAVFPWAEIGLNRLLELTPAAGFELRQAWTIGERSFCRLAATRR